MPVAREVSSSFATHKSADAENQVRTRGTTFSDRLNRAMLEKGWKQKDLSEKSGVDPKRVSEYLKGPKSPAADNLFPLADALGVSAEWLALERGPIRGSPTLSDAADTDWVMLPRYDLLAFTPEGKAEPMDIMPIRRPWLKTIDSPTAELWIAAMPMAVPDVAGEGETLLCRDAEPDLMDGRLYIFTLDSRPLVRRVALQPEGFTLISGDPMIPPLPIRRRDPVPADEQLIPVARILARIGLQTL